MHKIGDIITVNDSFQTNYEYLISAKIGNHFQVKFNPYFSPKKMLSLGIFEGKYCNDCIQEYPNEWFENAKISQIPDIHKNYFGVKSRQPLSTWKDKGWILEPDPRGWFQWYCRYYIGRRIPIIDKIQINRWRNFIRHAGQIRKNCAPGDIFCRPRQRQALLQWSHNPFI